MARLLVQLKLRLLCNALRASTAAKTSLIVSVTFAVLVAIGTFLLVATFRGKSTSVDLTSVIFTVFAFGWLIVPLFTFGLDGTLDPAALALYPVRTRQLAAGLLAASATGAWPLANVLGLLGVTVGLARGAFGELVAVIAVALQVLFCIALTRLVTTSMAGLLRSRRGKDLAAFLVIPVFALYELFIQVVPKVAAEGKINAASFTGFDSWMRWLPPGLAAHAIQDASGGHPATAVARLALLVAVIAVLVWLWVRSLGRALVTADASTQSSRVRGPGGRSGLAGRRSTALPLGGYGLRGALAARFWIYQRREPTSLVFWGITAVIMVAVSIRVILSTGVHPTGLEVNLLLSAVFGAAFVGVFHANSVGLTGSPFVFEALALTGRRQLRAYFSGQDIALAVIGMPLLTGLSFGLAAVAGHPAYGFLSTATSLAGLGAALALSNVFTVMLPYPMEKRPGTPVYVAAQGYGAYRFADVLGVLLGVAALTSPVVIAALLTNADPAAVRMPVLVACAAAYGLALAWAGVRIAASAAVDRLPELCQVAIRSKAAV
jgi:ABC-2 type transport system permease protein